jgi:CHAD domain-containing protein
MHTGYESTAVPSEENLSMAEIELARAAIPVALDSAARNPSPPSADSLVKIVKDQLETLRSFYLALIEASEVEAIHKMRVTTRRLQASLDLVQGHPDRLGIRKSKRQLRGWRRRLSEVRNYDVFLELLERHRNKRAQQSETGELLKATLASRRARNALRSQAFLQKVDIEHLAEKFGIVLPPIEPSLQQVDETTPEHTEGRSVDGEVRGSAPPLSNEMSSAPVTARAHILAGTQVEPSGETTVDRVKPELKNLRAIAERAASRLEQRLAEFQQLAAQSHPTRNPADLHQLRIAAKRVRYLLETVSRMGFGDATQALSYLRSLQDRIGEWHDLEALEDEIITIVGRRKFLKSNLAESERIVRTAARLRKQKLLLARRVFPINPPSSLWATCRRITRALRRKGGVDRTTERSKAPIESSRDSSELQGSRPRESPGKGEP